MDNFKEQDEGDAQEVAAVHRDSLPWWKNEGKEKTAEAKPQLVPARGANSTDKEEVQSSSMSRASDTDC